MNFYTFVKFTRFLFLSSCNIFSLDPRNILISYTYAGDEGEVGEKDHGSIANLGVVGVGPEVVGGGFSMAEQRWRGSSSKSGDLRQA
jgi:hypothetical protein